MDPAYYVAAGSLKARSFQMEVVSNNLANSATVGYKPDRAFFAVFNKAGGSSRRLPLSGAVNDGVVFGETGVITDQGTLRPTARNLDMALQGEGFFMVQTPQGIRATRDGRFQMGVNGQLQALDGSPVMGKNGQPVAIDPKGGELSVTPDGGLSQAGNPLGALDIKAYENAGAMSRSGNLRFDPTGAKEIPAKGTVQAGVLEQSAVDLPSAMVEMIRLNRLFEMSMKVASTISNDLDARSIGDIARTN